MRQNPKIIIKKRLRVVYASIALLSLVVLIFLLIPSRCLEEETPSYFNQYEFLMLNVNTINYYTPLKLSEKFQSILNSAQMGVEPLRILHIGDSHVQADFFTGETRRLLSTWFDNSHTARGFTFPYSVVGSNNPDDYKVSWNGAWHRNNVRETLGLGGISVQTSDKQSSIGIELNTPWTKRQAFDRVTILYNCSKGITIPYIEEGAEVITKTNNSIEYKLSKPTTSLSMGIQWSEEDCLFTLHGIGLNNSLSRLQYHAAGVNGASVQTFIHSKKFPNHIKILNPQIILLSLGTNDAYNNAYNSDSFIRNLSTLIEKIESTVPDAMIILTTPGDHLINREIKNPNLISIQDDIKSVALTKGCGIWDFYQIMGGEGSIDEWDMHGLSAPDKLHLNRKGYKLQGKLLFDALLRLAKENPLEFEQTLITANE